MYSLNFAVNGSFAAPRNSLHRQTAAVLLSDTLAITYDAEGMTPIYISGKISENRSGSASLGKTDADAEKRALCRSYLSKISRALRIARPSEELSIRDETNNSPAGMAHYKIKQQFRGIPVLGAEATLHLHDDRAEFVGRTIATPDIATVPAIGAPQAASLALSDLLACGVVVRELTDDEEMILDYTGPTAELVIYPSPHADGASRLAYQVFVRPNMLDWWEYIVDAQTGEVLLKYNRTCDAGDTTANVRDLGGVQRLIHTYLSDKYYLIDASRPMFNASKSQVPNKLTGAIVTYDYQNKYPATSSYNLITSTQNTWDAKAVSAHYNASVAYEYYRTVHERNSIDGNGGTIRSFINVADQSGVAMDNAYWNGRGMYYGNGSKVFTSLAAALDVAGHELTHGVIEATAALRYVGQSGALNESFADIFGCMIERVNWTIGESVLKPGKYASNALRDLSNPHNGTAKGKDGWQPQSMSEYKKLSNTSAGDNGGVHINSGIPNYAYYLFAASVGKEKAERVFYRTLTAYLSASSQFADLRIGSRLACEELFGKGSPEDTALSAAFDSVGILDNTQPFEHVADLQVNPGKEFVLLTAAPPAADGTTLYIADSAFGSLKSISKRSVKFRPSVSDDGKKVLFVSGDKMLIALTLNGTTATETVIDTSKVWSLCAISRDGRRFAAVRNKKDTAIYIGSMNGGPMRKFNLNGAAADGSGAVTGAVNSTALEWNFSGDEVVFDVYNSLAGPSGTGLTFWDIGFLRAWDPAADSIGDGDVSKLFNNLGDGISVGNPTFSKNSPAIIAYESIDDAAYSTAVMSMNMENRKTVAVATTAFPGYPSFSKRDDKLAFSTISGADTVVSVVNLKADKQTPDGKPVVAIKKMKWAVFFADGTRELTPTRTRQTAQIQPVPKPGPGLTVQPSRGGLKAIITGAGQTMVHIGIVRADGKTIYRETVFATADRVPYFWSGKTTSGTPLPRGVYFIQVQTLRGAVAKKLLF
jgi:Zn-dependent metalloprotease